MEEEITKLSDIKMNVRLMIQEALDKPSSTFFGGKEGYDVIAFDNSGKIVASGSAESMIQYAIRFPNLAVAILIPVMFSKYNNPLEDKNA